MDDEAKVKEKQRGREKNGVDQIERPTDSREKITGVFDIAASLHDRLCEISDNRREAENEAENDGVALVKIGKLFGEKGEKTASTSGGERESPEETLPSFLWGNVWDKGMLPDERSREVSTHIAELGNDDQPKDIEVPLDMAGRIARDDVNDLGDEAEKPDDIKQPEERIGHRREGRNVPSFLEHLPPKNHEEKAEERGDFEVRGLGGTDLAKVVETSPTKEETTPHPDDFKVGEALVIEHRIKLPEADEAEGGDQKKEPRFRAREDDSESDGPECERATEAAKKNEAR